MKKILFIACVLMCTLSFSQADEKPYKTWAFEVEMGGHSLIDASTSVKSGAFNSVHAGVLVRKNLNETFGLGLRGGYDVMELDMAGPNDIYYVSLNLEAIIDVLDVVGIYSNKFTVLAHGGPGVSWTDYRTSAQLGGGFSGLLKIGKGAAFKAFYSMNANINEPRTFDDVFPSSNNGVSSMVNQFGIGLVFYPGNRDREHADWYNLDCGANGGDTIINKKYETINNNITKVTKIIREEYNPIIREYVFFDHDKDRVRRSELNAVYQIQKYLEDHPENNVVIIGWASHTKSSSAYNLRLSMRRCESVKKKLVALGIAENKITIDAQGKDFDFSIENNHDVARRVELLVVK